MTTEQRGAVTSIYYDVDAAWEQWILFTSDNHFDSIYCNREVMKADFEEAVKRNARIFILGDWYDAMQGRYDPRRSMPELRPEYQRKEDYYDVLVKESADWLEPYAANIDVMADGNHELGVLKNANTNIMDRLVGELNRRCKTTIRHGGYGGWVRMMLHRSDRPECSVRIKYFHGSGGEAPVTRGAIQTNRQAVYLPDANIIVNGHSHNAYYIPITRERLSNKGIQYMDNQHHIRTPGYKQGYGDGTTGWEITRGGVPKPIGSVWVKVSYPQEVRIQVVPQITAPEIISVDSNEIYNGKIFDDDQEGY
jgi:predicted phosphodiesterase